LILVFIRNHSFMSGNELVMDDEMKI